MGMFKGINKAKISETGNYLPPDFDGVVEITRTIIKETRKKGPAFIVDLRIVESNLDDVPVEKEFNWFQKMTDTDIAFPAIKAFFAAAAGVDPRDDEALGEIEDNIEEALEDAVQNPDDPEKNMLIGLQVRVITSHKETQEGKDFTRHDWRPLDGSEE